MSSGQRQQDPLDAKEDQEPQTQQQFVYAPNQMLNSQSKTKQIIKSSLTCLFVLMIWWALMTIFNLGFSTNKETQIKQIQKANIQANKIKISYKDQDEPEPEKKDILVQNQLNPQQQSQDRVIQKIYNYIMREQTDKEDTDKNMKVGNFQQSFQISKQPQQEPSDLLISKYSNVTAVFLTCCKGHQRLRITLQSFIKYNTFPLRRIIVINDGSKYLELQMVMNQYPQIKLISTQQIIGEINAIDFAYSFVDTPYVYFSQDNWKTVQPGLIQYNLFHLENDSNVLQVWNCFNNQRGYVNMQTKIVDSNWLFGGFSLKPSVNRMDLYKTLHKGYSRLTNNISYGKQAGHSEWVIKEHYRNKYRVLQADINFVEKLRVREPKVNYVNQTIETAFRQSYKYAGKQKQIELKEKEKQAKQKEEQLQKQKKQLEQKKRKQQQQRRKQQALERQQKRKLQEQRRRKQQQEKKFLAKRKEQQKKKLERLEEQRKKQQKQKQEKQELQEKQKQKRQEQQKPEKKIRKKQQEQQRKKRVEPQLQRKKQEKRQQQIEKERIYEQTKKQKLKKRQKIKRERAQQKEQIQQRDQIEQLKNKQQRQQQQEQQKQQSLKIKKFQKDNEQHRFGDYLKQKQEQLKKLKEDLERQKAQMLNDQDYKAQRRQQHDEVSTNPKSKEFSHQKGKFTDSNQFKSKQKNLFSQSDQSEQQKNREKYQSKSSSQNPKSNDNHKQKKKMKLSFKKQ